MGHRRSSWLKRGLAAIDARSRRGLLAWLGALVVACTGVALAIVLSGSSARPPHRRLSALPATATAPAATLTHAATTTVTMSATTATTPVTTATTPATTPITAGLVPPPPPPHRSAAARERAAIRRLVARGLPLYCGGRRRRLVALTFDDGPGVYTHYAVAKLRAAHVRATFFLVGNSIRDWPGMAQRERPVAAFGDHTMTHPLLPSLRLRAAVAQIREARRLIERTVHEPVFLFRPPYEAHTPAIDAAVKRLGMVEVLWDVDSADSLGGNYRTIERRVIAGLRPGSIILMHENHGQTIRALDTIIAALRRRHLRAVTIPQLIAQDPPSPSQLRRGYDGCPVRLRAGNGR